jgi:hypothetical protein
MAGRGGGGFPGCAIERTRQKEAISAIPHCYFSCPSKPQVGCRNVGFGELSLLAECSLSEFK